MTANPARDDGCGAKIDFLLREEYERPDWNKMIELAAKIIMQYGNVHCFVFPAVMIII